MTWSIEFGQGQHTYHGQGAPPRAFLWFELPRSLNREALRPPWSNHPQGEHWRIERKSGREWLEGRFDP